MLTITDLTAKYPHLPKSTAIKSAIRKGYVKAEMYGKTWVVNEESALAYWKIDDMPKRGRKSV